MTCHWATNPSTSRIRNVQCWIKWPKSKRYFSSCFDMMTTHDSKSQTTECISYSQSHDDDKSYICEFDTPLPLDEWAGFELRNYYTAWIDVDIMTTVHPRHEWKCVFRKKKLMKSCHIEIDAQKKIRISMDSSAIKVHPEHTLEDEKPLITAIRIQTFQPSLNWKRFAISDIQFFRRPAKKVHSPGFDSSLYKRNVYQSDILPNRKSRELAIAVHSLFHTFQSDLQSLEQLKST